jgi:hypothetical protein
MGLNGTVSHTVAGGFSSRVAGLRKSKQLTRIEQALIEAIGWPEQQLMPARRHRVLVPVRRRVVNVKDSHSAAKSQSSQFRSRL